MNKLSKDKRDRLILVCLAIGIVLGGLWFFLINPQRQSLRALALKQQEAQATLNGIIADIERADKLQAELETAAAELNELESTMVSGDPYSWIVNTIGQFKSGYAVDIPQIGQPSAPSDVAMMPRFPYRQMTAAMSGSAYFHDLGRFLADLENHFPHMRVQNLEIDVPNQPGADSEKLNFKMDVVALVKSPATRGTQSR